MDISTQTLLNTACEAGAVAAGVAMLSPKAAARLPAYPADSPVYALCTAFSYLAEDVSAPICRYARGKDYHIVLRDRLTPIRDELRRAGYRADCMADSSPLPEVSLAVSCGVGILGNNGLVIVPGHGSWVVLGFIVTDAPLSPTPPQAPSECLGCNACLRVCPTGALTLKGLDPDRCLSAVTQRKGELTEEERAVLREVGTQWGCDRCQEVCPMNRGVPLTELREFREELIRELDPKVLAGLTRREFTQRYPNRAFTWRGAAVIRRNGAVYRRLPY